MPSIHQVVVRDVGHFRLVDATGESAIPEVTWIPSQGQSPELLLSGTGMTNMWRTSDTALSVIFKCSESIGVLK